MRTFLIAVMILTLANAPLTAFARTHTYATYLASAPADEYFGPFKMSVLEIRNRLNAFDARSESELRRSRVSVGLNNLDGSILAWQRKYPGDPWLPGFMARLVRSYERAGLASTAQCQHAWHVMIAAYPRSRVAHVAARRPH
jgi:hypothetical protein